MDSVARRAVVIVGAHSAGKSTLGAKLATALKRTCFEMGDIVREEAAKRGEQNLVVLAAKMLDESPLCIAQRTLELTLNSDGPIIIGPRTQAEVTFLAIRLDDPLVVGLAIDDVSRHDRWVRKQIRYGDSWSEREKYEEYWETHALVTSADLKIDGRRPIDEQVTAIVRCLELKSSNGR